MSGSLARSKSLLVPSFGRIQICIRSWCPCLWYMRVKFWQYVNFLNETLCIFCHI
jgi:hypothetical protein